MYGREVEMKGLYKYIAPYKNTVILAITLKAISTICELMIPFLMSYVIDEGISHRNIELIIVLCGAMLVMTILGWFITAKAHILAVKGGQNIGESLRNILFDHIQKLTIYDVEKVSTASLITRVTSDVEHIQRTVMMTCRMMVRGPLIMIGGTVMSLLLDPYLTCVMFGGMFLLFGVSMISFKLTRPIYRQAKQNLDKMTSILRENLGGMRQIKAFGKIKEEVERLDGQSRTIKDFELKAGKVNAYTGPLVSLVVNVTIILILIVSGMRVNAGELQIGKIVTILNYINMVLSAMMAIPRMFMMYSQASSSGTRIQEVLSLETYTQYGEATTPVREDSVLAFKEVCFKYPYTKQYALENISFHISRGETMAIIGTTGAGKTSILNLILRLYEPTKGQIYFQGRNIKDYDKKYLTQKITAAMQQYNIFSMSIKENIILDKAFDEERLEESVNSAQIRELLEELDEHFEHEISQNGNNLSGGQKQRISVARTLYRQSDLVILDDVSSALDYKTDLKLRQALRENYAKQTVILIAQRISSIKNADKILVLEEGKQVGLGTHESLLQTCEVYREICKAQEKGEMELYETII